jgi:hypothetical protein
MLDVVSRYDRRSRLSIRRLIERYGASMYRRSPHSEDRSGHQARSRTSATAMLGKAKKVIIERENTTIVEGNGKKPEIVRARRHAVRRVTHPALTDGCYQACWSDGLDGKDER